MDGSSWEVFRTVSLILGTRLRRIPDGAVREISTRWQKAFGPEASHNPFETMYADPI